ncbi:MAG: endonuclease VII domain-containing protein [Novosphingobium sp.]
MAIVDGKIRCSVCREWKETGLFPASSVLRGNGSCRACNAARSAARRAANTAKYNEKSRKWYANNKAIHFQRAKKWADENKQRLFNNHLLRTYGINLAEYNAIIERQGGGCGICGVSQENHRLRLAVDHCHETGKVRGVLCQQCNRALGVLGDNVSGLMKAVEYLKGA